MAVDIDRQIEIVGSLAKGLRQKEIASALQVSVRTIEKQIETMKEQWNANSIPHLVYIFIRETLIEVE